MPKFLDEHGLQTFWNCIKASVPYACKTTAEWNAMPQFVGKSGYVYVYSDARIDEAGQPLAAFKVGNGNAYLIDMPFCDEAEYEHIRNTDIHVTLEDKDRWNKKVRCYMSTSDDMLIFTTN